METQTKRFLPILIAGSLILLIGFSPRASFGLFQIPVANEMGWDRAVFSFAIAVQNLAWGFGQPIFGAIAERIGDRKAILLGVLCYVIGLVFTAFSYSQTSITLLEILIGFGIAGMGFGVILALIGRAASDRNRSLALGIATAAGSAGQILGPYAVGHALGVMSWREILIAMAALLALSSLLVFLLPKQDKSEMTSKGDLQRVLKTAATDINYHLIFLGFFSCGFQLAFVTAHFPAMIAQFCGPIGAGTLVEGLGVNNTTELGGLAIAIIGFMNIIGSIIAGWLGRDFSKKYLLAAIYLGRSAIAAWFIMNPITPNSVIIFSAVMGFLWLATVPLTSGLVGYIYGLKNMGTLYGIVFFSHQLGSFMGVWIGGVLYDRYGDYNAIWWFGVGLGIFSALVHLPIRERPARPMAAIS